MSFLLSFEGPVDLVHALEADLVRRGVGQAWVRARAHMKGLEVRHVDADGLRRTSHASEGLWPSVELEGVVSHGEPTRLHVRGVRATEFGYVHIAGELSGGVALQVSVLVTPLGERQMRVPAPTTADTPSARPAASRVAERTATPLDSRATASAAIPAPTSAWGAAIGEAAKHSDNTVEPAAQQLPRRGDGVDHFAFGRCEIVKCDGERAHLRVAKDGRVKEIAMDLLKISFLGFDAAGARRYRFDRKA